MKYYHVRNRHDSITLFKYNGINEAKYTLSYSKGSLLQMLYDNFKQNLNI